MKLIFSLLFFLSLTNFSYSACVSKYKANLRSGPDSSTALLGTLKKYAPLKIISKSTSNEWVQVESHNLKGWLYHTLLDESIQCIYVLDKSNISCPGKKEPDAIKIHYKSSFKVVEKSIGCNLVEDKWRRRFWVSTFNVWPQESAMKIVIPNS